MTRLSADTNRALTHVMAMRSAVVEEIASQRVTTKLGRLSDPEKSPLIFSGGDAMGFVCKWKYDEVDEKWDTQCGTASVFMEGGPKENKFIVCPYCGGRLQLEEANDDG